LIKKLADCVEFGNKLAYIKVAMNKWTCFCCAYCEGLMEFLAKMGKALMIMMINQFFTYLGYAVIMLGGAGTYYYMYSTMSTTPILGFSTTAIAMP